PAGASQPAAYPALVDAPGPGSSPGVEAGAAARPDAAAEREGHPPLQSAAVARELTAPPQELVQRQLQVLAAPVLRWEGESWSGLFMSLLIQPPRERGERARDGETREGQDEQDEGWQSQFTIVAGALGSLRVQLWLRGDDLDLQ